MNTRTKGNAFERDIARELEGAGLTVRGLESGGDHFAAVAGGAVWHVEGKRQERLQLHIWLRQQDRDCPPGMLRVLVFKRSREPAYAVEPFAQFLDGLRRDVALEAARVELAQAIDAAAARGSDAESVAAAYWLRSAAAILSRHLEAK